MQRRPGRFFCGGPHGREVAVRGFLEQGIEDWFNIEGFERNPANTPTAFNKRAFPYQIDGLRGPGLQYVNLNIRRNFGIGGRRTLQARLEIQNLLN